MIVSMILGSVFLNQETSLLKDTGKGIACVSLGTVKKGAPKRIQDTMYI